jgi:hypothetical protein
MKQKIFLIIFIFLGGILTKADSQISNLIIPARYFVNHIKELNDLDNRLLLHNKAGIVGISGIGKTQLARMYAHKYQNKYNLIWFFDCNIDLSEQFVQLIKKINVTLELTGGAKLIEDVKSARSVVIDYLTSQQEWLLVFDNLKLDQNYKLQDIIDLKHNGNIILCSQDSTNLPYSIQLPYLSPNDSMSLVKSILNGSNSKLAEDLANIFKGYPLLIAQGAIFLSDNQYMDVVEYKKLIKKADNKAEAHIKIVLNYLPESSKDLLYKIAIINNHAISKNILENIVHDKSNLSEDIYNLKKFGLIMPIDDSDNMQIFEMHDMIKETVLEVIGNKVTKGNIGTIIDKLNTLTPKGVVNRYLVLTEDKALKSNLESLLDNAEKYGVDFCKVMELRKNLMSLYLNSLDYYNCQKMKEWLLEKKNKENIDLLIKTNKDKVTYSEYIADIGVYEDFAKTDYISSIKFLEEARDIVDKIQGYPEVKFTIFAQLAQIHAFCGNISIAEKNLRIVEELINNSTNVELDIGLYWFIKAKISLSKGDYKNAELAIEKNIEVESHLPQNSFTAPTYILQAEILNFLGQFQKAYNVSKRIYDQETENIKTEHEIHARILVQLSSAELGLGYLDQALINARKAVNIYMRNDGVDDYNQLSISHNTDLASALVVEGESLAALGEITESMKSYATAETIYYNRYRDNIKYMDNISYLYLKAALSSYNLPDKFWYTKFSTQLIEKFGANHFRSLELLKKCRS